MQKMRFVEFFWSSRFSHPETFLIEVVSNVFRKKSWPVVLKKNSGNLTIEHLRTGKKKQNHQLCWSFLVQHLVQLTLVVPGTFLTRLNWSLPFWVLNHEAKSKIVPVDHANQYIDSCAFVKTVLMIPVVFLWHTCLQSQDSPLAETTLILNWQTLRGLAVCANVNLQKHHFVSKF